ncbi:MAG: TolC family outer membrane protein [Gammaproteobacteria bacterium]
MFRKTGLILLALGLCTSLNAQAETLWEVYEQATRNDPALREAEANMRAQMETKPQSLAPLLPQLSANGGLSRALNSGTSPFGAGGLTAETDTDQTTTQWGVSLSQSLLNTTQWRTLKRSDKEIARAAVDYQVAEQDLMLRVSEAYFNVLAAQDQLASERAAKDAIARQLEQANRRFEVGLIAITDVKEAQAAYDDAVALEIAARRALATAKEALREITGQYPETLAAPGREFPLIPPEPQVEQDWVDVSLQQNLPLESSKIGAEITRDNIAVARGDHWPTLDFNASYGSNRFDLLNNQLPENNVPPVLPTDPRLNPIDGRGGRTQVGLQLNFPIYSGGGVSSRVQEQVYLHRAARENFERVARQTERQTRDAYLGVIAEIARVQALARSEESNQTALEATEAGYEVGTRTSVDVLNARRSLFLAQTQYARSKYDYLINVIRLKQAAGTLQPTDIKDLDAWLIKQEKLEAIPGRGATPDLQLTPGTPSSGGVLDLPGAQRPGSESGE